ncbi:Aste57867_16314 [Aphanomyces stellatus]|uniref:Aste57867_16314 protein n=1 Tax=Aphanomyces stellatus TaxID=120398 RepID=A0A485L6I2_9STRA|nr:hypothetical protein As57867_016257 [Aphanomyces stellatus]VFT93090.1 Aste57867_16314 [Aphanomyces stellatus]
MSEHGGPTSSAAPLLAPAMAMPDGLLHPMNPSTLQPTLAPKPIVLSLPKKDVPPPLMLEREIRTTKHAARNVVACQVKTGAGILYSLVDPVSHACEPPDVTWLKLLEAIALIPSGKPAGMVEIIAEVYRIMPLGEFRNRFQSDFRHELYVKSRMTPREGLVLKDKVNRFLRAFVADPVEGYVTSKAHIRGDLFTDDIVFTPMGQGFVRAFRASDRFYTVVFPWGHGYLHEPCVSPVARALKRPLDNPTTVSTQAAKQRRPSSSPEAIDLFDIVMQRPPDSIVPKVFVAAMASYYEEKLHET